MICNLSHKQTEIQAREGILPEVIQLVSGKKAESQPDGTLFTAVGSNHKENTH